MKTVLVWFVFCLAMLVAAAPPALAQPAPARPIELGVRHELASQVLGDTRELNVWAPAGYAEGSQRYSVVYVLDGAVDQDYLHIAGLGQLGELSATFGPVLIVGVQTRQRVAELTPPATDARYRTAFPQAGGAERFRRFLRTEVMPFIAQHYPVGDRAAIMGESLAGLFVVDTLLAEPGLFADYIAISPSLWWDDRRALRQAAQPLSRSEATGRRLYLAIANEGGTMADGVGMLKRAVEALPAGRLAFRFSDRSATETHSTIYHAAALDALRWLYAAPPQSYGPTPWYMQEGAAPQP